MKYSYCTTVWPDPPRNLNSKILSSKPTYRNNSALSSLCVKKGIAKGDRGLNGDIEVVTRNGWGEEFLQRPYFIDRTGISNGKYTDALSSIKSINDLLASFEPEKVKCFKFTLSEYQSYFLLTHYNEHGYTYYRLSKDTGRVKEVSRFRNGVFSVINSQFKKSQVETLNGYIKDLFHWLTVFSKDINCPIDYFDAFPSVTDAKDIFPQQIVRVEGRNSNSFVWYYPPSLGVAIMCDEGGFPRNEHGREGLMGEVAVCFVWNDE
jgi:hypothetical protein